MKATWFEIIVAVIILFFLVLFLIFLLKPAKEVTPCALRSDLKIRRHGIGIGVGNPSFCLVDRDYRDDD